MAALPLKQVFYTLGLSMYCELLLFIDFLLRRERYVIILLWTDSGFGYSIWLKERKEYCSILLPNAERMTWEREATMPWEM